MRTTFDLVSHCYSVIYPHYAKALCYQLTSILDANKLGIRVCAHVCCDRADRGTTRVIQEFERLGTLVAPVFLSTDEMSRRSIGRNIAMNSSFGDVVWFADCDQVFDVAIWGRLSNFFDQQWGANIVMVYPNRIKIHRDHATGDQATGRVVRPGEVRIDDHEFIDKRYDRAIGGVHIVVGGFAREHGYLRDYEKWQTPNKVVLGDFRDDLAYRHFCQQHGRIIGIDLPGMFRVRHSKTSYQ